MKNKIFKPTFIFFSPRETPGSYSPDVPQDMPEIKGEKSSEYQNFDQEELEKRIAEEFPKNGISANFQEIVKGKGNEVQVLISMINVGLHDADKFKFYEDDAYMNNLYVEQLAKGFLDDLRSDGNQNPDSIYNEFYSKGTGRSLEMKYENGKWQFAVVVDSYTGSKAKHYNSVSVEKTMETMDKELEHKFDAKEIRDTVKEAFSKGEEIDFPDIQEGGESEALKQILSNLFDSKGLDLFKNKGLNDAYLNKIVNGLLEAIQEQNREVVLNNKVYGENTERKLNLSYYDSTDSWRFTFINKNQETGGESTTNFYASLEGTFDAFDEELDPSMIAQMEDDISEDLTASPEPKWNKIEVPSGVYKGNKEVIKKPDEMNSDVFAKLKEASSIFQKLEEVGYFKDGSEFQNDFLTEWGAKTRGNTVVRDAPEEILNIGDYNQEKLDKVEAKFSSPNESFFYGKKGAIHFLLAISETMKNQDDLKDQLDKMA
ncbi:hypothetical protein ACFL21_00785 [Patescibacteria group bacterium]